MNVDTEALLSEELDGAIGKAYAKTYALNDASGKSPDLQGFVQANMARLCAKIRRQAKQIDWAAEPLFEHPDNPRSYVANTQTAQLLPIVTLTTISDRLTSCLEVVKRVVGANAPVHSVNLYISSEPYLIDKGVSRNNELLKPIHEAGANVYMVPNTGPYRKMIPLIFQLRAVNAPGTTPILTVDDDVDYPKDAWDRMFEIGRQNEGTVIAHRGRRLAVEEDRISSYRQFTVPDERPSFAHLPNGRNGVLYRLSHFGEGPEHFAGSILAPTADDLWAKCSTVVRGIPVIVLEPTAMDDVAKDYPEMFPELKTGLFHNYNAKGGNDEAFQALEAHYSQLIETPIARLIDLEASAERGED